MLDQGDLPRGNPEPMSPKQNIWSRYEAVVGEERQGLDQLLRSGTFVVLDGPFGVGKNRSFAVPLFEEKRNEGYSTEMMFGSEVGDAPDLITRYENRVFPEFLAESDKRFLTIDEFNLLIDTDPSGTERLLRMLNDNHVETLVINATRTQAMRDVTNQKLVELGQKTGIPINIHKVETTHIPPNLVKEYLEKIGADPEVVKIVLDPANKALLVPRVFNTVVEQATTMDELREVAYHCATTGTLPNHLQSGQGGSREDMWRAFKSILGDRLDDKRLNDTPDYN